MFKLYTILRSVMKLYNVLFCPAPDMNHPFVQGVHTYMPHGRYSLSNCLVIRLLSERDRERERIHTDFITVYGYIFFIFHQLLLLMSHCAYFIYLCTYFSLCLIYKLSFIIDIYVQEKSQHIHCSLLTAVSGIH